MADAKTGLFQKLMKNPQVMKMVEQMFNSMGAEGQANILSRPNITQLYNFPDKNVNAGPGLAGWQEFLTNNKNAGVNLGEQFSKTLSDTIPANSGIEGVPVEGVSAGFGDLGSLALGAAKAHPFKTMGLIGSTAGNIGGLTDNDKFGGQLAGLGLGGLGAYALAQGNPYMAAMMTMGGGNLGALFDKLRARKEAEQAQSYYGGR